MPRKKKVDQEEQKMKEIEEKMQENKPTPILWKDLEKHIGNPVWDSREKKWRVFEGYKHIRNTYSVTFSDIADWVSFYDRELYLEEIK